MSADTEHMLAVLLKELPLKQAVQITGAGKNELYQRALEIKQGE